MKKTTIVLSFIAILIIGSVATASFMTGLGIALTLLIIGVSGVFLAGTVGGFFLFISDLLEKKFGLEYLLGAIAFLVVGVFCLKWLIGVLF